MVKSEAKKLLAEALSLSQADREELVGALSRSFEPSQLPPEWEAELARRLERIENGEASFRDAREVLDELRDKYDG